MDNAYQTLIRDTPLPGVLRITLNRPQAANALNAQMGRDIAAAFALPASCRAVILTGHGRKAFCAGADLKERKGMDEARWQEQHHAFEQARDAILACPAPVIAGMNGAAYGGGLELALACDFIYAASSARFALPEATLGIMPGLGGTQLLPRAIAPRRARELLFTGRPFTAEEAWQWGLVNRICAPETLMEETLACAEAIAANAPLSVRAIKAAMSKGEALPVADALQAELRHYATLLSTKDRHEGINAFNEKRNAAFSGE